MKCICLLIHVNNSQRTHPQYNKIHSIPKCVGKNNCSYPFNNTACLFGSTGGSPTLIRMFLYIFFSEQIQCMPNLQQWITVQCIQLNYRHCRLHISLFIYNLELSLSDKLLLYRNTNSSRKSPSQRGAQSPTLSRPTPIRSANRSQPTPDQSRGIGGYLKIRKPEKSISWWQCWRQVSLGVIQQWRGSGSAQGGSVPLRAGHRPPVALTPPAASVVSSKGISICNEKGTRAILKKTVYICGVCKRYKGNWEEGCLYLCDLQ